MNRIVGDIARASLDVRTISRRGLLGVSGSIALTSRIQSPGSAQAAPSVIVVGAGISGIAAARELTSAGFRVTVVEARNRIGGRILTDRSLGIPVDLGASWIHGVDGNPISELSDQFGIETYATDMEEALVFDFDGTEINEEAQGEIESLFGILIQSAIEIGEDLDDDISVGEGITLAVDNCDQNLTTSEMRWLRFAEFETEIEYGASIDELSLWWWDDEESFGGGDHLFPGGYDQITEQIAHGLDIRRNSAVLRCTYSDDRVSISTDLEEFTADYVVMTVPLGVLQRGDITVDPPHTAEHQTAINRLGMGVLNKVVMKFEEYFWPADTVWLNAIPSSNRRTFTEFLNLGTQSNEPILVALTGGPFARTFGKRDDKEIVAEAMNVLRMMFGEVPDPTGAVVTRWDTDPFACGSYSHIPVGAHAEDYERLSEPVADRLFFAGEHTNRTYPSTVHGAFLSGIRAANQIIDLADF